MSQQEMHIGTLTEVKLDVNQTMNDLMMKIMDDQNITYDQKYSVESYFSDGSIDGYYFYKDTMYKVADNEYNDDDICLATKNENGTISFVLSFYNGGTDFNEMLGDALLDLK